MALLTGVLTVVGMVFPQPLVALFADYADPEGSTPARKGQVENTFSLRFGGDYFLTECFKIDLSVGTRLHGPHAMEVELGLAYGIPLKKRR